MRVKSNFLSKNAKLAFGVMAMCGVLFTSCYEKDDNLDVTPPVVKPEAATYSLVGDVTNYLGEAVHATITLNNGSDPQSGVSFAFASLEPKDYKLTISADGYQPVTKNIIINKVSDGQHSQTRADVTLAKITTQPENVLAKYQVQGLVKDQKTGAIIQGANVKFGSIEVTTNDNGAYTLPNALEAGVYVVSVTKGDEYAAFTAMVQLDEAYYTEEKTINKVVNFDINKIDVIIETYSIKTSSEDPSVFFIVKDEAGNEIANGLGSLDLNLPKGIKYTIEAWKDGVQYTVTETDPTSSQAFVWSVTKESTTEGSNPILITDPAKKTEITAVNELEGAVSSIIPQVNIVVPENAVDKVMGLNVRIIPTKLSTDLLSEKASVLTFKGTPSGTTFNTPLDFTFPDEYGLGNMTLFYLENNVWKPAEEAYSTVRSEDGVYKATIPHFSEFQFGFNISASSLNDSFEAKTGEGNRINNTGSSRTVEASYSVLKGAQFTQDLSLTLAPLPNIQPAGIELIRAIITDLVRYQYGITPDGFSEETVTKNIVIPAGHVLTAATATQAKTVQNYQIFFSEVRMPIFVQVEIASTSVLSQTIDTIGHGHGHGSDWNSGGGISVSE